MKLIKCYIFLERIRNAKDLLRSTVMPIMYKQSFYIGGATTEARSRCVWGRGVAARPAYLFLVLSLYWDVKLYRCEKRVFSFLLFARNIENIVYRAPFLHKNTPGKSRRGLANPRWPSRVSHELTQVGEQSASDSAATFDVVLDPSDAQSHTRMDIP